MTLDPFERARIDCRQDACENNPFGCVGGLAARSDLVRPNFIAGSDWPRYREGYEHQAKIDYGDGWREVQFGWGVALTLAAE